MKKKVELWVKRKQGDKGYYFYSKSPLLVKAPNDYFIRWLPFHITHEYTNLRLRLRPGQVKKVKSIKTEVK